MNFFNVLAHEGEEIAEIIAPSLDQVIRANSVKFSLIAAVLLAILVLVSILIKQKSEKIKYLLFGLMTAIILSTTIYLVGSTIYLNNQSTTGGPVHWHADYEIWNCGQLVELKNPEGLSNKVGSETVHEHNDQRIHIEGVILNSKQASLGHFFKEVGGDLDSQHLTIPTEDGLLMMEDGKNCPDGKPAKMQVFLYESDGHDYQQTKLTNPQDYVISPHGQVPPGDCLIIEFGPERDSTDRKCRFLPK
ncbi:hypothetical protein HYZ06_02140 [Candidatus Daviesbacteria bacterium]|nr:hypothetical protein [Candidatus Daviesbacteria bacterium]